MRKKLNKVPTRLKLKTEEVDMVIEAGRLATRGAPEFNGFLASLEGNDVESRIQKGIAVGGRRIAPLGN
jgi:NTE family protein